MVGIKSPLRIVLAIVLTVILQVGPVPGLSAGNGGDTMTALNAKEMAGVTGQTGLKLDLELDNMEIEELVLQDRANFGDLTFNGVFFNQYDGTFLNLNVDSTNGLVFDFPSTNGFTFDLAAGSVELGSRDPALGAVLYGVDPSGTTLEATSK